MKLMQPIKGRWSFHLRINGPIYIFSIELEPLIFINVWEKKPC